jgi:alpha-beta hydrolase superfamily lysophospholipase
MCLKVDDLYTFVGVVEQRAGGRLPAASTFLGGQSMGGLVAALGALRCQERWAGLIIFSGAMGVVWTPVLRYAPPQQQLCAQLRCWTFFCQHTV